MTTTLYDLTATRELIDNALSENGGELTPELDALLTNWTEDFDRKVEDYALVITEQKAIAEMINAEIETLRARLTARLNLAKRLTERLAENMNAVGKDKVHGVLKTVAFQKNPASVVPVVDIDEADLRNLAMIAPTFVRHEESWSLDKRAVLDAHKAGTLPDDISKRVRIEQTRSLRIR